MKASGLKGCVIRVAVLDDKIALIAGFGPGSADCSKDKRSRAGLNFDIDQEKTILFRKNCESVTIVRVVSHDVV